MNITKTTHKVNIDIPEFIKSELPNTMAFYESHDELHSDVKYLFDHHLGKSPTKDFYEIDTNSSINIINTSSEYYRFMIMALSKLLSDTTGMYRQFYLGMEPHHLDLMFEMARETYFGHGNGSAIYGRFDAAVDPTSGKIRGFYEFNGDTPCMLFESINLQSFMASEINRFEDQENGWWDLAVEQAAKFKGKTVALVCYTSSIEDIVNTETLSQVIDQAGGTAIMVDIKDLHHDVLNTSKPWFVTENFIHPDYIYCLAPWEEMIVNGYDHFKDFRKWIHSQKFLEPAWRWFMSHKGFMVYLTYLLENDESFSKYKSLPHIPTYYTNEFGNTYVSKPVTGRMSHNITIVKDHITIKATEGEYSDTPVIYQPYVPPGSINGSNFLMGLWVSPHHDINENWVSTICIREFDDAVLGINNERFVPHILK